MLQQMQQQKDPNQDLIAAATQQALGEANKLNAEAEGQQATNVKNIATAGKTQAETEKTKAETVQIVRDINAQENEQVAAQIFRRFAADTRIQ
jgi:hypothetical protein